MSTWVLGEGAAAEAAVRALQALGAAPTVLRQAPSNPSPGLKLVAICATSTAQAMEGCGAIRALCPRVPPAVVVVSPRLAAPLVERLLEAGADDWICWPLEEELLRLRLLAQLRHAQSDVIFGLEIDAISITDAQTQRFVDVNGAWQRLYGYSREEAVGRMGPKDVTAEAAATQTAVERVLHGGPICRVLRWHRSAAGRLFPVEIHAAAHQLAGRKVMVSLIRDVTERVRLEAQVRQAERMASLGVLAAGVAHEINNPLAFVLGNLDHLAEALQRQGGEGRAEPLELLEVVEEARDGARRVRQIVRDLKTFSRPEEAQLEAVDVAQVVEGAARLLSNVLRHRAQLVRNFQKTPMARGNGARLGQVLVNLLSNAEQALPPRPKEENRIELLVRPGAQGEVVAEIRDNGAGISPGDLGRIFDPFFTTKPVGEGTGLGLAVCQGIVDGFGGRIEVESRLGHGSTFRLILPAFPAGVEPLAMPLPTSTQAPLRLLLVDDERNLGRALERALEPEISLEFVTEAKVGLERIAAGERFDVVVCDLMMPTMNGMEFYQALLELNPGLAARTGFITGGTFTPPARAFAARMQGRVIEKPFLAEDLQRLLKRLLVQPR